ncbi:unnamed protein product [Rodentolepis nana]|uniref:Bromo domain-containing protein n=1 Tax=Rodentolepis nana TaxID=102285 RepID=A0A0R3TUV5_RODNA|nr:unnamed protein product [Rodentolepis nana]
MEPSSGSLRFKISLSKQEMEHEEPEISSTEIPHKTSYSLYIVLSEIHRLCVKRDHKGIFIQPVTEDIAPNYFSFISDPMDLGTMYKRLSSRNFYSTAGQYLDDLRLMCQNAMLYNPPDTIYYQKARSMLAFAEKLISPPGLRKLSAELLKTCRPLTEEEMGFPPNVTPKHHHHHHHGGHHGHHSHKHHQEDFQPGPSSRSSTVSKFKEEVGEKAEEVEDYAPRSVEREELDGTPSSSYSSQHRKRRSSNASMSSVSATKVPRYANSPPHLIPEVDDSFVGRIDSPRFRPSSSTQSTCGRSDVVAIDLENTEGDLMDYSFGASPGSSSTISSSANRSSRRPSRNLASRRSSTTTNCVAPNPRQSCTASTKSRRRPAATAAAAVEQRTYAEDAWTFTDTMTDRTPPDQVIAQVKKAAQNARAKYLAKYGQPGRQTVVYLDTSETGKVYAKHCIDGHGNRDPSCSSPLEGGWEEGRKVVNYPLAMRQLLTPKAQASGGVSGYHGLIEQMTSQQVATLHALSKLKYDPSEPIAMGIHGPLAIFEKEELAQMIDAYGGASDLTIVESVLSLLKFVEPIGLEARRVAHLRLADATDGYHAQMLISFADPKSPYHASNWMRRANLTIDPSIVEEFKATFEEGSAEGAADPTLQVSVSRSVTHDYTSSVSLMAYYTANTCNRTTYLVSIEFLKYVLIFKTTSTTTTSSVQLSANDLQALNEEESVSGSDTVGGGGQMSIAKLPSNTLTTNTTDKQMTAFQPHNNSTEEETASDEQAEEGGKDGKEEEEEEEESFDILTEALNAAIVTPADRNQPVLPDVATVNELAQISALTAAISPIQQNYMPLPTSPIQHSPGVPTTSAIPQNVQAMACGGGTPVTSPMPPIGQAGEPKYVPVLASGAQVYPPASLQIGYTLMQQSELAQNMEANSLPVQETTMRAAEPLSDPMSAPLESLQTIDTQICHSSTAQKMDIPSVPGVPKPASVPLHEAQDLPVIEKHIDLSNISEPVQTGTTQPCLSETAVEDSSKADVSSFNPDVTVNSPHLEALESQINIEVPNANIDPLETTANTQLKFEVNTHERLESSCTQDQADENDKKEISVLSESQQPFLTNLIQSTSGGPVSDSIVIQDNQAVPVVESFVEPQNIPPDPQIYQSEFIPTLNVAKEPAELKVSSETPAPHLCSDGFALSKDVDAIPKNVLESEDVDQKSIETAILYDLPVMEENAENSQEVTQQKSLHGRTSEEGLEVLEVEPTTAGIQVEGHEIGSPELQQKEVADKSKCAGLLYKGGFQQGRFPDTVTTKPTAENESSSPKMGVSEFEPNYDVQESIFQPTVPQVFNQEASGDVEMHPDFSSENKEYKQEPQDIEPAKGKGEPTSIEHLSEVRKELDQESTEASPILTDSSLTSNRSPQILGGSPPENKTNIIAMDEPSTVHLQLEKLIDASECLTYSNDMVPTVSYTQSSMTLHAVSNPSEVDDESSENDPIATVGEQGTALDLCEPVDSTVRNDKQESFEVLKSPNVISDVVSMEVDEKLPKETSDSSPLNTAVESEPIPSIQEPAAFQNMEDFISMVGAGKGPSSKLQEPLPIPQSQINIDTYSVEPPESFVVPESQNLEPSLVSSEEGHSKDHSEMNTVYSSDDENPAANQLSVESSLEEQNSVQSSIPSILPCDNASIQPDPILTLPTFETSNSPVSVEAFNPQQANLDEDAQTGYPHSDITLENGGGLVDYEYTDSSTSGSTNPP